MTLYQITDNKNIPIYIGITKNKAKRFYYHDLAIRKPDKTYIRNGKSVYPHRTYLYNKLRQIINENPEYVFFDHIIVLHENFNTYQELAEAEIKIIDEYKKQGLILCNLTNGGEGTPGKITIFTDEWRANLSKAKKEYFANGGKNSFAGKKHSQETLDKIQKTKKENIESGKTKPVNHYRVGKTNEEIFGKEKASEISKSISKAKKGKQHKHTAEWEINRIAAVNAAILDKTIDGASYHVKNIKTGEEFIWNKNLYALGRHLNTGGDKFYVACSKNRTTRCGYQITKIN